MNEANFEGKLPVKTDLNKRAFAGLGRFIIALALMIFLPAWTIFYWQAWIFLIVFFVSISAITIYLMKKDPVLLERRMKMGPGSEKEKTQQRIQLFTSISFVALLVFPSIDHRFAWSAVPAWVEFTGDGLVMIGLFVIFRVFKENSFTSGIIEIHEGQKVISTGPYAVVRHPMYSGGLIMLAGIPLSLGSIWGLLFVMPATLLLAWRLLNEEKFLMQNLPGYREYENKVKWRLLRYVW